MTRFLCPSPGLLMSYLQSAQIELNLDPDLLMSYFQLAQIKLNLDQSKATSMSRCTMQLIDPACRLCMAANTRRPH